jgi:hypothetical protein
MIHSLDSELPKYARWLADMKNGGEQNYCGMVYIYLDETKPVESFDEFLRVSKTVGSSNDKGRLQHHEVSIKAAAKNLVGLLNALITNQSIFQTTPSEFKTAEARRNGRQINGYFVIFGLREKSMRVVEQAIKSVLCKFFSFL